MTRTRCAWAGPAAATDSPSCTRARSTAAGPHDQDHHDRVRCTEGCDGIACIGRDQGDPELDRARQHRRFGDHGLSIPGETRGRLVGSWTAIPNSASLTRHTVSNLVSNKTYQFQIRAKNNAAAAVREGLPSDPVDEETPPVTAPFAPTNFQASPGATRYFAAGLAMGKEHEFQVRATSAGGVGEVSGRVTATPVERPNGKPSAPRSLRVRTTDSSRVDLRWAAPDNTGGSRLIGYRIEVCTVADCFEDTAWEVVVTLDPAAPEASVTVDYATANDTATAGTDQRLHESIDTSPPPTSTTAADRPSWPGGNGSSSGRCGSDDRRI